MPADGNISCSQFSSFLINQTEFINQKVVEDIVPQITWMGEVETGEWPSFTGTTRIIDRFHYVAPDLKQPWNRLDGVAGAAVGAELNCQLNPCDPERIEIGYGMSRQNSYLERIGYKTDLICLDSFMTQSRATDLANLFPSMLSSATIDVVSNYRRVKTVLNAGKKVVADATMTPVTWSFNADGSVLTTSAEPTSMLLPAMLQRLWGPLVNVGAAGKNGWSGNPAEFKLITDYDSLYQFSHGAGTYAGYGDNWRFTEFDAASELFTKYGLMGKVGNFNAKVDPTPIRLNKTGTNTFVRVWPRKTASATVGIKSDYDPEFDNAKYQISIVKHRMAWVHKTLVQGKLPGIPLASRSLSGAWRFVTNDLGVDNCGKAIDNSDGNKGRWQNDFVFAAEPMNAEFDVAILHQRQPATYTVAARTLADPGAYTAATSSTNTKCPTVFQFLPTKSGANYGIAINLLLCGGVGVNPVAVAGGTTIATLVTALNTNAGSLALGVWSAHPTDPTRILLKNNGTACSTVTMTWT